MFYSFFLFMEYITKHEKKCNLLDNIYKFSPLTTLYLLLWPPPPPCHYHALAYGWEASYHSEPSLRQPGKNEIEDISGTPDARIPGYHGPQN